MTRSADAELDDISIAWRGEFVDQLLIMWAVMGTLALLVSISRAQFTGWLPVYTGQIVLLSMTLVITLFRKKFSATFKAAYAITSNMAVGVTGIYALGLMSGGVWFFPVAVLLLALFVTRRLAMWLTGGIFLYMILVGYGHITGRLQLPAPADIIATSALQWASYFVGVSFFFVSLILMVSNYRQSMNKLFSEISRQRDEIARLADFDALTGLPVLRLANDRLDMACRRAERSGDNAALLFIDLDGFKEVNDAAGHEAGDHCLQVIAARLRETLRAEDTAARFGGDEFIVVMSELSGRPGAAQLAAKLVALVAQPIDRGGQSYVLGASIGIALFPDDGGDGATLMRRADQAMYKVKRSGKNNFAFVDPEPGAGDEARS